MTPSAPPRDDADPAALAEALGCVLRFGELKVRAGTTAFRVRESMGELAAAFGIDELAVHVTLGGMTATARRGTAQVTLANEIGPPGINAWRLGALERLALTAEPDIGVGLVSARLDAIATAPALHAMPLVAAAIGGATGAFAFLNGGGPVEVLASGLAGALGQALRTLLSRRRLNQYAIAALCAAAASGLYCLIVAGLARIGVTAPRQAAGFIASVLFLVPGFPLVAALLDMIQHQITAGIARLAYGAMVLAGAAFGLSLVVVAAGLTPQLPPPLQLAEPGLTLLRAAASMVGGCGFAILYNSRWKTVATVGGLALLGNGLRLALHDAGLDLAPATFCGAFTVGLLASQVRPLLHEPRIALTVPGIIIMVPGALAFQTVVQFNQGDVLSGLRSAVVAGFVGGAMALGLAAARLLSARQWRVE